MATSTAASGTITAPLVIVLLSVCFGSNFQFYSNSVINNLADICQTWMNQSFYDHYGSYLSSQSMNVLWSFSTAAVQLGCLTGAVFTRFLADRHGRRRALVIISLSSLVGSLLDGFAKLADSFEMFVLGRYFLGGGLGCGMAIASIFITEIAPTRYRGACGATQQVLIGFGNVVSFVLTLSQVFGNEQWWPITVSLPPFVTSLTQLLVLFFYARDSPRFLILSKYELYKGLEALKFYQGKAGAEIRLQAIEDERRALERKQEIEKEKFCFLDVFRRSEIRKPLLVAIVIMFGVQMSGVSAILAYSKTMFMQAGLDDQMAQYASLGIGLVNCITPFLTMFLVERAGRRLILLLGLSICDVALIALTVCIIGSNQYNWTGAAVGAVPCLYLFQVGFALSNSIALIAPAELFPQEVRASAMTVIFSFLWALQTVCVLGYLPFSQWVGVAYSYLPFIAGVSLAILVLLVFMPETKGKTMEQVAAMFARKTVADSSVEEKRLLVEKF